ncbi:alpha/beta-hydrolase [Russula earlei]|uniref:Alpha/beta-hydrolase n=1 Tax=Russula earlei TaxID=71964 RepID=A0ACC0UA61_9AGAM|nr:alpha/beta-hydrolase [Russula earlei]
MWLPFHPMFSMAAGLSSSYQQPFNISGGNVTGLADRQLDGFTPYIEFARAAYCNPNKIDGWKCGGSCDALPGFMPSLTGGDGDGTQFFYVGYWPAQSAVVVAHQGTDPSEFLAVFTDLEIDFIVPDPDLFLGIPADVKVHSGFAKEHKKSARPILAEVKRLMVAHSSTHVVLVGHSLGGAVAELDSLYMKLNLPADTTVRGVTFGTPRVGNQAWATFFDSQVSDFTRINNKRDPVPIIPGRALGFRHPSGEIHIDQDGSVYICPGPDNTVGLRCTNHMVPNVGHGNVDDHSGPYNGIFIGTKACTP